MCRWLLDVSRKKTKKDREKKKKAKCNNLSRPVRGGGLGRKQQQWPPETKFKWHEPKLGEKGSRNFHVAGSQEGGQ